MLLFVHDNNRLFMAYKADWEIHSPVWGDKLP